MLLLYYQTHLSHVLRRSCCEAVLVLLVVLIAGVFGECGLLRGALEVGEAHFALDRLGSSVALQLRTLVAGVFGVALTLLLCLGSVAHFDCSFDVERW